MSRYNFKFGDYWISELGAVSAETPPVEIAQRDFSMVDIPGKNGADYIDNGRYENVEMERSVSLIGRKSFPVEDKAVNFINTYAYLQGYQAFEDTDHNDMVTEAVLTNFDEINRKLRTLNTAKLKFSRKPFWYLKSGLEYTEASLSEATAFDNPYMLPSMPIIMFTVTGGSPATFQYAITTGGTQTTYNCINVYGGGVLTIDCEKCIAVLDSGTYAPFDVPPGFGLGRSTFQFVSGADRISRVQIAPRWRCL